jgi:hypothetical protein
MFFAARTAGVLGGVAIAGATVALAAGSLFTPKLGTPNGKHVKQGPVTLTAKIVGAKTVFLWLTPKDKIRAGKLVSCTNSAKGCDYVEMKKWKGHADGWVYDAPAYKFAGWWTTTPNKYYWQVESIANTPPCTLGGSDGDCVFNSKVGTVTVR